jgi:hypothetical protein
MGFKKFRIHGVDFAGLIILIPGYRIRQISFLASSIRWEITIIIMTVVTNSFLKIIQRLSEYFLKMPG